MKRYWFTLTCAAVVVLAGCATNKQLVATLAAAEFNCSESELTVSLRSRSEPGVGRYDVTGCNKSKTYVCDRMNYTAAIVTTGQKPFEPICERER